MALELYDRVKETATTTGTGTFTLAGAVTGFRTFGSVLADADTTYYVIELPNTGEWEVGLGTIGTSGTTLARTTPLASSNGGAAVNFSAGTKQVYVTIPAAYLGALAASTLGSAAYRSTGTSGANVPLLNGANTWSAAQAISSNDAASLVVGPNGATNPAFQVNSATGSMAAGLLLTGAVAAGTVALAVISSGANANLSIDAKGSGTIGIGAASTGRVTITPVTTITGALTLSAVGLVYDGKTLTGSTGTGNMVLSASPTLTGTAALANLTVGGTLVQTSNSATAFASGPNGSTNPVFLLVNSTGSQAAGLSLTGAVAAGTVAAAVISSGANASLSIDAKGSGTIGIGAASTGRVTITPVTTITGALTLSAVGLIYDGKTLTGSTGTGNMVLATSPTLTTPVLGVATATSVAADTFTLTTSNINSQSGTSYTLVSGDNGKTVICTNSSAVAVSLDTGLTAGFWCRIVQDNTGQVTVGGTATSNSANGKKTRARYSVLTILYAGASNTYYIGGDTAT